MFCQYGISLPFCGTIGVKFGPRDLSPLQPPQPGGRAFFPLGTLIYDDGKISGMLCVVTEETKRVIGERQLAALRDLPPSYPSVLHEEDRDRTRLAVERAVFHHEPYSDLPAAKLEWLASQCWSLMTIPTLVK